MVSKNITALFPEVDPQQASSLLVTKYLQVYKGKFQLIPQTELIFASEKKWPMRLTGLHGQKRVQSRLRAQRQVQTH